MTRADDSPEECVGKKTICGVVVPKDAMEYARSPRGPCRPSERDYPTMLEIVRGADSTGATCKRCLEKITRP
jgi:hypothetical protein